MQNVHFTATIYIGEMRTLILCMFQVHLGCYLYIENY